MRTPEQPELRAGLKELQLAWPLQHYETLAGEAAREHWTPVAYLGRLVEGDVTDEIERIVVPPDLDREFVEEYALIG